MNRIRVSLLFFVRGCRYALLPLCIAIVLLCCDGRFVNDVWAEGDTTETYVATTYEELTEEVRSQIIARNAAFTVLYDTSDPDDIYQAATYAIEHAFDETDDPRSGPYLEFHVRNLDYNGYETVVGDEAATYYELSFECSCLSTAEQEAAVDAFVSEWIAEHDYSDPCDTLIRIAYLFQGLTGVNLDATVYETFFDKNGCGEGVARAVQRLCKEAGISCVCTGAISQGTIIDYNLVELDGLYYIFDVVRNAMLKGSGSELCRVVYPVSDEYPMAYNDYVRDIDYTFDETTGTLTINSDILDFYVDATEGYNPETGIYEYLVDLRPWAPIQTQIRKIVMTDNVKYMGEFAFACQVQAEEYFFNAMPLLTEVVIGGGITKIGNRAFNEIPALERVSGGEGVTRVGYYAFWNCTNLQAVDFLSNLISVREYAFAYCSSLVAAEPFSQLDIVGEGSFAYCSSLTNLVLPQEMTSIDKVAFAYTCVENFQIPRYIDRVGEEAFHSMQVGESSGTLTLPADWVNTELDLSVFSNCNFTTLIVEEGWEVLGSSIFYHTPFKTLFLPKGLTDIDGAMICNPDGSISCVETFVFAGTSDEWLSEGHSSIFEYNVSFFFEETSLDATWRYENGTLHISGNGALAGHLSCEERPWNQYADSITRVIVEDGVTGLGSYCCANMPNLIEVQLPSSLKTINWRCFENSSNIVSLQLPDGLRYIYMNMHSII